MNRGVLLYGPPAVGKDTVTSELERYGPFRHFRRLKCGPGRTTGYRMVSPAALRDLPSADQLYTNHRYGSTYVVDRQGLTDLWDADLVPVVHLGQPEAIPLLIERTPAARWLVVELWSPLNVLAARITQRQTGDAAARIDAARRTPRLDRAHTVIDTSKTHPEQAAQAISGSMIVSRG